MWPELESPAVSQPGGTAPSNGLHWRIRQQTHNWCHVLPDRNMTDRFDQSLAALQLDQAIQSLPPTNAIREQPLQSLYLEVENSWFERVFWIAAIALLGPVLAGLNSST